MQDFAINWRPNEYDKYAEWESARRYPNGVPLVRAGGDPPGLRQRADGGAQVDQEQE